MSSTMSPASPTSIPWDPNSTSFPTRHSLPKIEGAPEGAAWVWGKDDYVGRVNLLTPARVQAASKTIVTGEIIPLDLPLNVPEFPSFGREKFQHEIKPLDPGRAYDDKYNLNTQSGTQWDGLRHVAHQSSRKFYNNTTGDDIDGAHPNEKCSIHHWAEHGIAGRGVLIDYWTWAQQNGIDYDPHDYYEIPYDQLQECGKAQGIDIRPEAQGGDMKIGDILCIRSGWKVRYMEKTPEERKKTAQRGHKETQFAGVNQEEKMLDWLHDSYFAAVAGDAPAFEAWPSRKNYALHEYILAMYGMPLGEMLDFELLARKCREYNRWFFFFTSAPNNCPRGVSSHVNGQAIL